MYLFLFFFFQYHLRLYDIHVTFSIKRIMRSHIEFTVHQPFLKVENPAVDFTMI